MSTVTKVASLGAMLLVSYACGPKIEDRFNPEDTHFHPPLRTMRSASLVVVGRVTSVQPVGGVRNATRAPELRIRLARVTLAVENVLRGSRSDATLTFYYYAFSAYRGTSLPFHLYLYRPERDIRRIFFLKEEDGIVRSVGDVIDYTIPVWSGSHEGLTPPSQLCQAISWILLTPGKGAQVDTFAEHLYGGLSVAIGFDCEPYALAQLEALLTSDNTLVRTEARDIVTAARMR